MGFFIKIIFNMQLLFEPLQRKIIICLPIGATVSSINLLTSQWGYWERLLRICRSKLWQFYIAITREKKPIYQHERWAGNKFTWSGLSAFLKNINASVLKMAIFGELFKMFISFLVVAKVVFGIFSCNSSMVSAFWKPTVKHYGIRMVHKLFGFSRQQNDRTILEIFVNKNLICVFPVCACYHHFDHSEKLSQI